MLDKKTLAKIKKYFAKQPDVVAVYLYGSQARSEANVLSDVDIAVLLEQKAKNQFHKRLKFIGDIQGLIGRQDADIKLLNDDYSLNYLHKVLTDGKLIYARRKMAVDFFKAKINDLYFDFKPVLSSYYQKMHKRIAKGVYAS